MYISVYVYIEGLLNMWAIGDIFFAVGFFEAEAYTCLPKFYLVPAPQINNRDSGRGNCADKF